MTAHIHLRRNVGWVPLRHDAPEFAVAALPLGPPLVLTGTAGAIWSALARATTLPGVLDDLASQGLDVPDGAADTVAAFLEELAGTGLVEIIEHPSPSEDDGPIG